MSGRGFGPVWGPGSRLLILGTWPSPKSREMGFYYGPPQNRFWPLLAALTGRPRPQSIPEKKALILESGLALWDTLESCTIQGARDETIRDPVPNDVAGLLKASGICAVACGSPVLSKICPAAHWLRGSAAAQHQPGQRRLDHAPAGADLGRSPCPVPETAAVNKA